MAAKCAVLFLLCVTNGVLIGEASPKIPASSLSPWYCQRLVPAFITAALTPCTYPCLFLSPHQNPRIIVQPEQDGTPCKVTTGIDHQSEAGKCRGGVCRPILHQAILKRKKRFICLYAFVKWLKTKKKLEELKKVIRELEKGVERRTSGAMSSPRAGSAGATGMIPSSLAEGTGLNVGNGGSSFAGLSSGSLGVVSPAGVPATESTGNAGSNSGFPGMMGGLGSEMGNNDLASTGNGAAGTFGYLNENAVGSGIPNPVTNFASGSASASGLTSHMAGTAGALGIGGGSAVLGGTRVNGNLGVPMSEGGIGTATRRASISGSSSSVSVHRGSVNTGDGSMNVASIAAGSSAATVNASPVSNSVLISNPSRNVNPSSGRAAALS